MVGCGCGDGGGGDDGFGDGGGAGSNVASSGSQLGEIKILDMDLVECNVPPTSC